MNVCISFNFLCKFCNLMWHGAWSIDLSEKLWGETCRSDRGRQGGSWCGEETWEFIQNVCKHALQLTNGSSCFMVVTANGRTVIPAWGPKLVTHYATWPARCCWMLDTHRSQQIGRRAMREKQLKLIASDLIKVFCLSLSRMIICNWWSGVVTVDQYTVQYSWLICKLSMISAYMQAAVPVSVMNEITLYNCNCNVFTIRLILLLSHAHKYICYQWVLSNPNI